MDERKFTGEEVRTEVQRLLQSMKYQLEEPHISKEFMGKPDFYGKREEGGTTHAICGLIINDIKEIPRGVTHLWTIKRQLGEDIDYVIVLPPQKEDDLVGLLRADNNKLLKKVKREEFRIWLCNPGEKSICSVFGTPRDSLFTQYLKFRDLGGEGHTS